MAGKLSYILTTLVGVSKGWRTLISSTSSMTREDVGQSSLTSVFLIALAAKKVKGNQPDSHPEGHQL